MAEVRLRQAPTHYRDEGEGSPVVLIHGMGLDLTLWDELARDLAEDYRVIRLDTLGHGRSGAPASSWGIEQHARQVAELLDHLAVDRAVVLGFSLGGTIAERFAVDYPGRIAGLIVLASVHDRTPSEQEAVEARLQLVTQGGPAAVVDGALSRWFTPAYQAGNPAVIAYWRARVLANDPRCYANAYAIYARAESEFRARLAEIRVPALVMTGELDAGQNPRMARSLAAHLADCRVEILPGIPHMLPLEAAAEMQHAVRQFLSELADGRTSRAVAR